MRVSAHAENPLERVAMAVGMVPSPLFDSYVALMMARTIMAGVSLGVFDALAERPDDAAGVARRCELDPKGADILLTALHALGYVRVHDGRYENARETERWLAPGAPRPLRDWTGRFGYDMWEAFGQLEHSVRTGESQRMHEMADDDPYWERYMRGLFELSRLNGDIVARQIGARDPRRLLDLAGGHGGYAMALCRRHPELRATVIELEGGARIGRRIVEENGFSDRIEHRVGDLFELDLGTGHDLATAFSIVHHFEPEQNVALLERARAALRPGGTMAVLELERPPEGKAGTQLGTLTGLLFYVTSNARTYTADEMCDWLRAAGFSGVCTRRDPRTESTVLVLGTA